MRVAVLSMNIFYRREVFVAVGFLMSYFALAYALSGSALGQHLDPPADVLMHVLAGPIAFLLSVRSSFTSAGAPFFLAFTIATTFTFTAFWYFFVKRHDRYMLYRALGFAIVWVAMGFLGFMVHSLG